MPATAFIEVYESILLEDPGTQFTSIYPSSTVFSSVQAAPTKYRSISQIIIGGGFKYVLIFTPTVPGEDEYNLTNSYFSGGLKLETAN